MYFGFLGFSMFYFQYAIFDLNYFNYCSNLRYSDETGDIAAWFQYCAFQHILMQVHRGILFYKESNLLRDDLTLVRCIFNTLL